LWLAVARAWTAAGEAAAAAPGSAVADDGSNHGPDAPAECHERAYAAYASGLRELRESNGQSPSDEEAESLLSSGRMSALAALAAAPPAPPVPLPPPAEKTIKRVFVASDLHVDQPLPWRCDCWGGGSSSSSSSPPPSPPKTGIDWVLGLARDDEACLVVAGDVADSLRGTLLALAELRGRYARVFFVPGNHDLFLRGEDARAFPDSWCKLFALRRACARLGVETAPAAVAVAGAGAGAGAGAVAGAGAATAVVVVVVAPLLSWYDDGAFCGEGAAPPSLLLRHDAPCDWGAVRDADVFRVALSLARREMATAARAAAAAAAAAPSGPPASVLLLTATHFLPRPELPHNHGVMSRAMGCASLGAAVLPALAGAVCAAAAGGGEAGHGGHHIHAYGHSHVDCDRDDLGDGVRYVSRALGSVASARPRSPPGDRAGAAARSTCRCFEPLLVWEDASSP
jgi:hypothetical protein